MGLFGMKKNPLEKKAERGDAAAQYELGLDYQRQADAIDTDHGYAGDKNHQRKDELINLSYEWNKKAAAQGYTDAVYRMAYTTYYYYPQQRYDCLMKAAAQGHAKACTGVGQEYDPCNRVYWYEEEFAVKADYDQAIAWYKKGIERGDDEASQKLKRMLNSEEYRKLQEKKQKKARAEAEAALDAKMASVSAEEAVRVYADFQSENGEGRVTAEYANLLAELWEDGRMQGKNRYAKAAYWYKKSAELGRKGNDALYRECIDLAKAENIETKRMIGLQKQYGLSEEEIRRIESAGNFDLAEIYEYACRAADAPGKWEEKEVRLYTKAAEDGSVDALFRLGEYYKRKNDYQKAFPYYKQAAEQHRRNSDIRALTEAALCYDWGRGTAENSQKARAYYIAAYKEYYDNAHRSTGDTWIDAEYGLGECFRNGFGTCVDERDAYSWYEKAARLYESDIHRNYANQIRLGEMYLNGYGVKKDTKKGNELIREAVEWFGREAKFADSLEDR